MGKLKITKVIEIPENDCLTCKLQHIDFVKCRRFCDQFNTYLEFKDGKFLQCDDCILESQSA